MGIMFCPVLTVRKFRVLEGNEFCEGQVADFSGGQVTDPAGWRKGKGARSAPFCRACLRYAASSRMAP